MTRDEICHVVFEELARLAPEADLAALEPQAQLRADLDLDSFDFVQFIAALDRRLGIAVPEADYRSLETLTGCLDYLEARQGPALTT